MADYDIERDIKVLEEILAVAREAFSEGVPAPVARDLKVVSESIEQLQALIVYRDNYQFFKYHEG